ncbi:GGDEF domain-containing protein [Nitrosophilus labii]|uniref:GGDEF domain-containing protein n=1 Tax=Nitrosophilus labii TaxID=2706014 RepID=UPI0016570093|nr:GGDEF domain-containing protein [Nitrosophilus labii]
MNCKRWLSLKKPNIEDTRKISEVAKKTLAFMAKHYIPLTPKNYEDWFFVLCSAINEKHLLTDQNIFLLYEEYLKDKPIILDDYVAKEVSDKLKSVANESENIISMIDSNIDKHRQYIKDSKDVIEEKEFGKIKELQIKINELEKENRKLKEKINKNIKKLDNLQDKFEEYKHLSYIDPLTELYNRRGFEKELERVISDSKNVFLIYLDIDDFKKINDQYGHNVGDEVLKNIGEILKNFIRKGTKAFRLGGEEFAIILSDLTQQDVYKIAERLRKVIENHNVRIDEKIISYTASFGITEYKESESMEEFLDRADKAMYEAKKKGKNRVVLL